MKVYTLDLSKSVLPFECMDSQTFLGTLKCNGMSDVILRHVLEMAKSYKRSYHDLNINVFLYTTIDIFLLNRS